MKIRKRGNGYQLDLSVGGKRIQRSFGTRAEAEKEGERILEAGTSTAFTTAERQQFALARDRLADVGATIEEAVDHFLATASAVREPMTVAEMVEECLYAKWNEGKRDRYLAQLKCSAGSFARSLPRDTLAHEVGPDDVSRWLEGNGWSAKTRNVYLGDVRAIFAWGETRGAVARNPCREIRPARLDESEIEALSTTSVARLLVRAHHPARFGAFRDESFHELLPYVVLATFAGIRPEEITRIDWDQVSLEEACVVVLGRSSKTRQRRVVDLSPNAVAWMETYTGDRSGPLVPKNFRKRWERLRRACGFAVRLRGEKVAPAQLRPWPHDVLRHTFASMHYAHHRNEILLQSLLGHTSGAMLFRHYRAITSRAEADRFWSLYPPGSATASRA